MEITLIILKGILLGITLSFVTGPAMFSLIQTSLNRGFISGMFFAMGIFVSDALLLSFTLFGFSSILTSPTTSRYINIIGGIFLIMLGTYTFLKKKASSEVVSVNPPLRNRFIKYLSKGFLFNVVNPGVWFFWLIPVGISTAYNSVRYSVIFLTSMLLVIFSFDLLKCLIAAKLKAFLTDRVITLLNKVLGAILVVIGIYLIVNTFHQFEALQHILNKRH